MASSYEIKGKRLILKNNEEGYLDDDEKKKIPNTFTEIEFPSQYEQLYSDDFKWCKEALGRTTLLDFSKAKKMTSIDDETFTGAKNLVVVVLPENLEYSPEFKKCPELKELHIGKEADTNYGITKDSDKRLTVYCSSPSLGDSFDNQFLKDVGVLYVDKRYLKNYEKARDDYDDELDIRPFPEGYSFPKQPLSKPWCDTIASSDSTFKTHNQTSKSMAPSVSDSNLKTKDMNNNQSEMANAIEKQIKALQEGPKFDKEFMVYFDSQKAEGPYNDVYMFCFIKHKVISKETKIFEKGTSKIIKAGDCKDLEDFFSLFSHADYNVSSVPQEETPEEALHKAWDEKLSKSLIDNFIENADLFNNENGSELIDEDILESIYTQTESFNLKEAEVHFQVSDLEGYANEELTDKQSEELNKLARKVLGFLLHKKWDETLPPKMVDLIIKVADLFDDPYDEKYIDRKICVFTYKLKGDDSFEIDDFTDRLEGILVDDVTPTAEQEKILHEIAVMMHNYVNS